VNVRAIGLLKTVRDIEETVMKTQKRNGAAGSGLASVMQGPKIGWAGWERRFTVRMPHHR